MPSSLISIWERAARLDPTLAVAGGDLAALRRRKIRAVPYSRERLFTEMAAGRPVIFTDFAVRVDGPPDAAVREKLLEVYRTGFPRKRRARVQVGPSQRRSTLPVPEMLRRWDSGRAIISVTDLHIRGTRVERALGVDELSDFNVLLLGSDDMSRQEMMTLVISSAGNVTDSHSDDPDGSNHCFVGKKLWLAWDTFDGQARGLEDHSRTSIDGLAAFDMRTFLSLRSARWFFVSDGQTLFLPGKLTHKVITFEQYLGVGSFYVALPSALETLVRWYERGPLWSLASRRDDGLVDEIARTLARHVRALRAASREEQERWGLSYLDAAVERFTRTEPAAVRARLQRNPAFAELVATVQAESVGVARTETVAAV
ncbi:MAG: hypothetical protein M3N49_14980 [Candidatus Eremiobacteraeota bacterium]|nr:hypothetical protein [Candidatus Eremiobacteraeota bacterium]